MLKVYRVAHYVAVDGDDWRKVSTGFFDDDKYIVSDKQPDTKYNMRMSFDETREYLYQYKLVGLYNGQTYWRKKPTIRIKYYGAWDIVVYKRFNTLSYKTEFEEVKDPSLSWLERNLSSEDSMKYLHDKWLSLQNKQEEK